MRSHCQCLSFSLTKSLYFAGYFKQIIKSRSRGEFVRLLILGNARSVKFAPTLKKYILIYDWVGRVYEIVGFRQLCLASPAPTFSIYNIKIL